MSKIKKIKAREILDSRGNPTVEVKLTLENGWITKAAVPSGASTGKYESQELRDNDPERYSQKGVLKACEKIEKVIAPQLIGQEPDPQKIDRLMIDLDGTKNKSQLGSNAILGVSLAVARAGAYLAQKPLYQYIREKYELPLTRYVLPTPMFNVINGGKHSDSGLDVQEFMVIPTNKSSFREKLRTGAEIFVALREVLKSRDLSFAVGDEGGFAPQLKKTKKAFELLISITDYTKHSLGTETYLGLDVAAAVFYSEKNNKYLFEGKKRTGAEMLKIYYQWFKNYPLMLLEDPFAEDDWEPWSELTAKTKTLGNRIIVGDDIFTTNVERLKKGIEKKTANAVLIKLNQIGTLTETIQCIQLGQEHHHQIVISHRSGETNDDFIADLAVAVNADFIKAGAPNRGERVAKYNRLMEIEDELALLEDNILTREETPLVGGPKSYQDKK
jgi:enolase